MMRMKLIGGKGIKELRITNDENIFRIMRCILQRVSRASVSVDQKITGRITIGLLVLAGFEETDSAEDLEYISGKISKLRIFDDENGVMNLSVKEKHGNVLAVSQFTLYAATKKGNRPSYIRSAKAEISEPLYRQFLLQLEKDLEKPVQSGIFGAHMEISLVNDGPVTIILDSNQREF